MLSLSCYPPSHWELFLGGFCDLSWVLPCSGADVKKRRPPLFYTDYPSPLPHWHLIRAYDTKTPRCPRPPGLLWLYPFHSADWPAGGRAAYGRVSPRTALRRFNISVIALGVNHRKSVGRRRGEWGMGFSCEPWSPFVTASRPKCFISVLNPRTRTIRGESTSLYPEENGTCFFFYTAAARLKLLAACHTSPKRMLKRWSAVSAEFIANNNLSVLVSSHLQCRG